MPWNCCNEFCDLEQPENLYELVGNKKQLKLITDWAVLKDRKLQPNKEKWRTKRVR